MKIQYHLYDKKLKVCNFLRLHPLFSALPKLHYLRSFIKYRIMKYLKFSDLILISKAKKICQKNLF